MSRFESTMSDEAIREVAGERAEKSDKIAERHEAMAGELYDEEKAKEKGGVSE